MENLEARQQAIDLVTSFDSMVRDYTKGVSIKALSKDLAVMTVEKILLIDCWDMSEEHFVNHIEYWEEVKREIEKS